MDVLMTDTGRQQQMNWPFPGSRIYPRTECFGDGWQPKHHLLDGQQAPGVHHGQRVRNVPGGSRFVEGLFRLHVLVLGSFAGLLGFLYTPS